MNSNSFKNYVTYKTIYLQIMFRENKKTKESKSDEFIMKKSQC